MNTAIDGMKDHIAALDEELRRTRAQVSKWKTLAEADPQRLQEIKDLAESVTQDPFLPPTAPFNHVDQATNRAFAEQLMRHEAAERFSDRLYEEKAKYGLLKDATDRLDLEVTGLREVNLEIEARYKAMAARMRDVHILLQSHAHVLDAGGEPARDLGQRIRAMLNLDGT